MGVFLKECLQLSLVLNILMLTAIVSSHNILTNAVLAKTAYSFLVLIDYQSQKVQAMWEKIQLQSCRLGQYQYHNAGESIKQHLSFIITIIQ